MIETFFLLRAILYNRLHNVYLTFRQDTYSVVSEVLPLDVNNSLDGSLAGDMKLQDLIMTNEDANERAECTEPLPDSGTSMDEKLSKVREILMKNYNRFPDGKERDKIIALPKGMLLFLIGNRLYLNFNFVRGVLKLSWFSKFYCSSHKGEERGGHKLTQKITMKIWTMVA